MALANLIVARKSTVTNQTVFVPRGVLELSEDELDRAEEVLESDSESESESRRIENWSSKLESDSKAVVLLPVSVKARIGLSGKLTR